MKETNTYLQAIAHKNYQIVAIYEGSNDKKDVRTFYDGYEASKTHLKKLNTEGYGIFITTSLLRDPSLQRRKIKDYERSVGVCMDVDNPNDTTPKPEKPTMVVETSPGKKHYYYLLDKPTKDFNAIKGMLLRGVESYGADPAAIDIARILRLPGFYNCKEKYRNEDGQLPLVALRTYNEQAKYTLQELRSKEYFPKTARASRKKIPNSPTLEKKRPYTQQEIDQCRTALHYIDPDNADQDQETDAYTSWRNTIFAIHEVFAGSTEGYTLAVEWSSGELMRKWFPTYESESYKANEEEGVRTLYESINPDPDQSRDSGPHNICLGTIIFYAKKDPNYEKHVQNHGYKIELITEETTKEESLREEFIRTNAKIVVRGSTMIAYRQPLTSSESYDYANFTNRSQALEHIRIAAPTQKDPNKTVGVFDAFKSDPDIQFFGGGTEFRPIPNRYLQDIQHDSIIDDYKDSPAPASAKKLNTFIGFTYKPIKSNLHLAKIKRLVLEGAANNNLEIAEYLHNFAAHMIQKPQEKMPVLVTFVGSKGSGKSQLASIFRDVVHPYNHVVSDYEGITGRFSGGSVESSLCIQLEEVTWAKNNKENSKLKHLITTKSINVERKGVNLETNKPVFYNLIGTANEGLTAPQGSRVDERRYLTLDFSKVFKGNKHFWDSLGEENDKQPGTLRADIISAYVEYLLTLDLTQFDPTDIPYVKSDAATRNRESQQTSRISYLLTAADHGELLTDEGNVLTSKSLQSMNEMFENSHSGYALVKAQDLIKAFADFEKDITPYDRVGKTRFLHELKRDLDILTGEDIRIEVGQRPTAKEIEEYPGHLVKDKKYARIPSMQEILRIHEEYLS